MYVPNVSTVFRRIFHVFHLDVVMTIQVCFNSILHMLQWSDRCCRGDETLRRGRDATEIEHGGRQGVTRMAPRRGEERGVAGKERGGLDTRGAAGMGIESRMVGHGHWCGTGRRRADAISLARDLMRARGVRCETVAGIGAASRHGLRAGRPDISPSILLTVFSKPGSCILNYINIF